MPRNIWDPYANWTDVANLNSADEVRDKITGHKGKWLPNAASAVLRSMLNDIVSAQMQNGEAAVTALDFGCGLGRNLPLLRELFPRVVGFDLPEMIQRLRAEGVSGQAGHYDATYDDLDELLARERVQVLYDSVVLQHIVDVPYAAGVAGRLHAASSLQAVVSLSNLPTGVVARDFLIGEHRWQVALSELDTESFFGAPHRLMVLRRPAAWRVELREDVIGIVREDGSWLPLTINGAAARRNADWEATGVITALAPIYLVTFERPAARAAWFVDDQGRYLGSNVKNLTDDARAILLEKFKDMLGPWLQRQFHSGGLGLCAELLSLLVQQPAGGGTPGR